MKNFEQAKAYFFSGLKLFEKENYKEAEVQFIKSLELFPDRASTLTNLSATQIKLKKYSEAEKSATQAISLDSRNSEPWFNLGLIEKKNNNLNRAIEYFDKAIQLKPDYAEAWANKAVSLIELERYDEALAHYDQAIKLKPDYAEAWANKGVTLSRIKRYDEALAHYDKAIQLKPDYAEAWANKGVTLSRLKRYGEDIAHYDQAIQLKPDYAEAWANKGATLYDLKRYDEAIAHCNQAIQLKPDHANAYYSRGMSCLALEQLIPASDDLALAIKYNSDKKEKIDFILASLKGENQPSAPPKEFITELFDDYAAKFESHLVNALKYRAHDVLYRNLKEIIEDDLDILDLGCGTGLMGELLKPHAEKLTGIDISSKIIEEARAKNVYDQLYQSDLNEFLQANTANFDLVSATDVLIYMGDLSKAFLNVYKALRKGGYFCFTVEKLDAGEYFLNKTLRYSHSVEYCENLAKNNQFQIVSNETNVIREENGVDVLGLYFVLRKM